ncbi:DUF1294 domain-containing protein [Stenotrophomonas sp. Y-13]|uniref:DUF1294 domain-containing protein n=1 Tax=Stenotrophomonas sp. Y-13 TaxID=3384161 RepID=UPI0039173D08
MPQLGRIEQWNDGKGHGFVRPLQSQAGAGDAARAFVHIKAIAKAGRRPADGDLIRYDCERDARGRLNAVDVTLVNAAVMRTRAQRRVAAKTAARQRRAAAAPIDAVQRCILACALIALAAGGALRLWPLPVTLAYVAMGTVSFFAYARDKNAASNGQWRTRESTLHAFDLLCGWPGGLLAQQAFRHKTRKIGFQLGFWTSAVLNCAALYWLLPRIGTAS